MRKDIGTKALSVNTRRLASAAMLTAAAVLGSAFSVPVFGSKCAPAQHFVNVLCAVLLGPGYAVLTAFSASLIRNLLGLGSVLAFPGSMCGALLSGLLYKSSGSLFAAWAGELFGTGILGALLAFPAAVLIMGNRTAAFFSFVFPFSVSAGAGSLLAAMLLLSMRKSGALKEADR